MNHSKNFNKVKTYYERSLWNAQMVKNVVGRWLTEKEAEEILTCDVKQKWITEDNVISKHN